MGKNQINRALSPVTALVLALLPNTTWGFHNNHVINLFSVQRTSYFRNQILFYTSESGTPSEDDIEEFDASIFAKWDEEEETREETQSVAWKKNARWASLNPRVKIKVIEEAHARAIRNKKKREPLQDKKRRLMDFYKKTQNKKQRSARVQRSVPLTSRTPLSDLTIGSEVNGTVISLTNFGVYVDIGTECDGLLHVGQITRDTFIQHPRQMFTPGDEVTVRISNANPEMKKLWLTMLPLSEMTNDTDDEEKDDDVILLEDISVDDELWGEIVRVTDYGSYVNLGAEVEGFLHFMDHPDFGLEKGAHPSTYMKVGQRVRVWASDIDEERGRIKLTANRPRSLPVLKREIRGF